MPHCCHGRSYAGEGPCALCKWTTWTCPTRTGSARCSTSPYVDVSAALLVMDYFGTATARYLACLLQNGTLTLGFSLARTSRPWQCPDAFSTQRGLCEPPAPSLFEFRPDGSPLTPAFATVWCGRVACMLFPSYLITAGSPMLLILACIHSVFRSRHDWEKRDVADTLFCRRLLALPGGV